MMSPNVSTFLISSIITELFEGPSGVVGCFSVVNLAGDWIDCRLFFVETGEGFEGIEFVGDGAGLLPGVFIIEYVGVLGVDGVAVVVVEVFVCFF